MLEQVKQIQKIDIKICEKAMSRWNHIAKPIHSLGLLEDAIVKIAGIRDNEKDIQLEKAALVILCADHGVVEEQVTQTDASVTRIVSENFTTGNTSAAVMAKAIGVDLYPVDIGISTECVSGLVETEKLTQNALTNRNIRKGTGNIAIESAMTIEECIDAIETGICIVQELKAAGYQLIATGEMGIGNTTPSSALATVLTGESVACMTGRGAGLSKEGLDRKKLVVQKAVDRYRKKRKGESVIELMAEIGGIEIAGMMGIFLGGAIYRVPVLMDGFISAVAALTAVTYMPDTKDYMLASHVSKEPGGALLLERLGLHPFLTCEMCLGEGTGAIAAIPILKMALAVYQEMSTFQDNEIEEYVPYEEQKSVK